MPSGINLTNINNGSIKVQSVDASVNNYVLTLPAVTDTLAGLTSPAFRDIPTAPTAVAGTNTTQLATTAFVNSMRVTTTPVTATGTSIDFTGIPSWVKQITVMLNGISTNGTLVPGIQLGTASSVETTGYAGSTLSALNAGLQCNNWSTSARFSDIWAATMTAQGSLIIGLLSNNLYVISGNLGHSDATRVGYLGGSKTLASVLTTIRITTGGADVFDAGSISIMYEG